MQKVTTLEVLRDIAARDDVRDIIEIGSSTGQGSTKALIDGVNSRSDRFEVRFFGYELFIPHYQQLCAETNHFKFFYPVNLSSISLNELPSFEEVKAFYSTVESTLNKLSIESVGDLYARTRDYMASLNCQQNGIMLLKNFYRIQNFDLAYIDGSEFSGTVDFFNLYGSRFIALDDINSFKCYNANQFLSNCPLYNCIHLNTNDGAGSSVYQRKW